MNSSIRTRVAFGIPTALLMLSMLATAQSPPATTSDGTPFLQVNINPTDTPPMVNINPFNRPPQVDIRNIPPVSIQPMGCDSVETFETGVDSTIEGPFVVTFLGLGSETTVSLSGAQAPSARIDPQMAMMMNTAMYLGPGQNLTFNEPVLFSGCRY